MFKRFCPYCGEPLENGCDCERFTDEERERLMEDYENSPEVNFGYYQQDIIDMYRRER